MNDDDLALLESTSMHHPYSDTKLLVTPDWDLLKIQLRVLFLLHKLMVSEQAIFNLRGKLTLAGRYLQELLQIMPSLIAAVGEYQRLHPTIEAFRQGMEHCGFVLPLTLLAGTRQDIALLEHFLNEFRTTANSVKHQRQLRNFQRAANKNLRGALAYVDGLFERRSRLSVVRLDLSYEKTVAKSITATLTRLHRKRLFKRVQSHPLFKHCDGYLWKLERGLRKGFHYHACFLFDGSRIRSDILLARRIGEYWKQNITGGTGLYFNCNAIQHTYTHSGIGDVHYLDQTKRAALRKAITYITKVDTAVRLVLPGNARTFGRGERFVQLGAKRGRRRQPPHQ
ncbi:Protein of uncharacterised function (DUF3296) [Serratia fonticola]|uniref:YagK/YfjJ domain-containing protein n=1 Tax=Serratia fonticola TaxID=47917 RepID=UPI0004110EA9|nr:inovirus-type Gp2 protein [Serratia fonticola]CAI1791330.1 Protein of uncharacterised function (DUF3296) [Serratia fonticola]